VALRRPPPPCSSGPLAAPLDLQYGHHIRA
jgi:hypothetical protein